VSSLDEWLEDFGCPKSYEQIDKDLKPFSKVRFNKLHESAIQRFNQPGSMSVCNYVIKDNEVSSNTMQSFYTISLVSIHIHALDPFDVISHFLAHIL